MRPMEESLAHFFQGIAGFWLGAVIVGSLLAVGKGADVLVDNAVSLSLKWRIPKSVIGATIVSLGTTMPEAAVSVLAAVKGSPDLALGNAVGSIICDTGLILGLAILIKPIPVKPGVTNIQGWIQLGTGILLAAACLPWSDLPAMFHQGGHLPQGMGVLFLILLAAYLFYSMKSGAGAEGDELHEITHPQAQMHIMPSLLKMIAGIAVLVFSSSVLIPAVKEAALRMHIPEGVVAATLVAFGTSLPELVTVVTASLKGHSELALGNVIGADILNVLFVSGAAAAVTAGGLHAAPNFFTILFPAMLGVLIVFRIAVFASRGAIKRPVGFILIGTYVLASILSCKF